MSNKLKYIKLSEATPASSSVLLQIRTGTSTGSQLVATLQTSLDATLRTVRERLVEIAVKGSVASSASISRFFNAECAELTGLSAEDVKGILSHRLHAFDMSSHFQFVRAGGCLAYTSEEEHKLRVYDAIPTVPSFGLPSTSPSWLIEPRAGSVTVEREYIRNTLLTINVNRDGEKVTKLSNAMLILYVRQGDSLEGASTTAGEGFTAASLVESHSERIILERLMMSDVPFGKIITPRHLSLLISRWNVNTKDLLGRTILHECCADGNLPAVKYILSLSSELPLVPDEIDYSGRTCLHYAVLGGHSEVVSELLSRNADPSLRPSARRFYFTKDSSTAIATAEEELASVGRALPFNPLRPDFMGRTPLHIALSLRHDALTEQLCNSISALPHIVLSTMHLCVFNLYYGQRDPVGRGLVGAQLEAATKAAGDKISGALKSGASTKALRVQWQGEERFSSITNLFSTLSPSLLQLASENNIEAMVVLLSHPLFDKSTALQRGPAGESLLHLAARKGHADMVRFLISEDFEELFPQNDFIPNRAERGLYGGSTTRPDAMADDSGRTPIHYACMYGYADTLLELLRHATASVGKPSSLAPNGAAIMDSKAHDSSAENASSDDDDERALIISDDAVSKYPSKGGRGGGLEASLRQPRLSNLDVNAVDNCGCSALHWALRKGHVDCARVMLEVYREAVGTEGGLMVSVADQHGMTPLHVAAAVGADDVVHTLIEDYRVHPNTRVLTSTAFYSRSLPSAKDVERRKEASFSSASQLLEVGPASSKGGKRIKVVVKTLGPSPLWLALQEERQQTASLLIDLGAVSADASESPVGVLPSIVDVDLTSRNDAVDVASSRMKLRSAADKLFMSPFRASRVPPLPLSRPSPSSTHAAVIEAQFWHMRAMLRLSLEHNMLGIAQILLTAMHQKGYGDRLAFDARLLIAFTARRNDYALRWLIDRGVGSDSHDQRHGLTILSACCYARNVDAVRYLLEAIPNINVNCGADAAEEESLTVTPLYLAVASSRHECASSELVDLLFRRGAGATYGKLSRSSSTMTSNTPRSSLYRPLVQAALRGDYSIVQTLCGYASTSVRDAAVALWWLLNAVPASDDALFVRRTVAKVLEAAEGPFNAKLRQAFGEPVSFSQQSPLSNSYSPSTAGVAQYDAIAVSLFRKVRFVAESPFHPFEFLHLASSKLWHFGSFVKLLVSSLQELPMDIKRSVIAASTPMDTKPSHLRPTADEAAAMPPVRIAPTSAGSFIDGMDGGSFAPYHRLANRDVFSNVLRNGPHTPLVSMSEWYQVLRTLVEDCGLFPTRTYDHTQHTAADYALMSGHAPSLLYMITLGMLPLNHKVPRKSVSWDGHSNLRRTVAAQLFSLHAVSAETISFLFKHHSIDYVLGGRVGKAGRGADGRKPPVPNRRGEVKERRRPRREAPFPIPFEELQEMSILASLRVFIRKGDVASLRSALSCLAAVCRLVDFSALPRPNVGASGPINPVVSGLAKRVTNDWGCPLVLCALECDRPAIARMLMDEFKFNISASVGASVSDDSTQVYQLLPNAIGFGCDINTIAMLIERNVPLAVPSALTRKSLSRLQAFIPAAEGGATNMYTALFVGAAIGRLDVVRLLHSALYAKEMGPSFVSGAAASALRGGMPIQQQRNDVSADLFANTFTLVAVREEYSGILHFDALAALAVSKAAEHTADALEIANFLICKCEWPYLNPYILRISAFKERWDMCRLLLESYGPTILIADLKVREAEVAEEERILKEKKGLLGGGFTTEENSVAVCNSEEDILSLISSEGCPPAHPSKIKGLSRCSAISVMVRLLSCTAHGSDSVDSARKAWENGKMGAGILQCAMDLLALSDTLCSADEKKGGIYNNNTETNNKIRSASVASERLDVDADREVDTIDERLERLKAELQSSFKGSRVSTVKLPFGAESKTQSLLSFIALYRYNVRLPEVLMQTSKTVPWTGLLLNHRPSLLKGIMIGGTQTRLAGYVALLAFCTQPLPKVAPPVQSLVMRTGGNNTARRSRSSHGYYASSQADTFVVQQLMSLLFELTRNPTVSALVPSDGYQRLLFILKAVIRRNQPLLLDLLLRTAVGVITRASLTDLKAMRDTTVESLLYLTLQHIDGQCTRVVLNATNAVPNDPYLGVLCHGTGLWTSETVSIPFASSLYQSAKLFSLGRVEKAPRGQLVTNVMNQLASAKGSPLAISLLDVSMLHSSCIAVTSAAPSLITSLKPYLSNLPGGVIVAAASPLLIAVALGLDDVIHHMLASKALDAKCSASRAFATATDCKATFTYNKELMTGVDERKRLVFLRDGDLSSTVPLPVVNVAVALCLKAALRVSASAGGEVRVRSGVAGVTATASSSASSPEAAFADFKRCAMIMRSLFKHGALHTDNINVISVAVGHILRTLSGLRVPTTMRIAIGAARAELLASFFDSSAACGSRGSSFLTPVRFTDRKRHLCLFTSCDLTNNRHMLHSLLSTSPLQQQLVSGNSQQTSGTKAAAVMNCASPFDVDILRAVLKCTNPSDVENARDDRGRSPLYYLLNNHGPSDVIKTLLQARPNARTSVCHQRWGWTPLMIVCRKGRCDEMLMSLLSLAELQEKDSNGCTALWHACANGHIVVVKTLIEFIKGNGGALGDHFAIEDQRGLNPLLAAAMNGHDAAVMKMLEYIPAKLVFKMARSIGWDGSEKSVGTTLMHAAAKGGCARLTQYLIDLQTKAPAEFSKLTSGIVKSSATSAISVSPSRQMAAFTTRDGNDLSALATAYFAGHTCVVGKIINSLRQLALGSGAASNSYLNPNSIEATATTLARVLDTIPDDEVSAVDKALLLGRSFDPFTCANPLKTSSHADPTDPFEKARLRDVARNSCEDADAMKAIARRNANKIYRSVRPIGWFGAAMRLDALLLLGGMGSTTTTSPPASSFVLQTPKRPLSSESSLLRWCVKNRFSAGIRVCGELGFNDGGCAHGAATSALHVAAKCINLDACQLLLSLNMSSPFALDRYGNTPLDVCLKAGAKANGVTSPASHGDECHDALLDTEAANEGSMDIAERCARFLMGRMFAQPAVIAQFKLPDGSLYIHSLFHKVAATRMPNLVGFLQSRLLALAGSGSSSPAASSLFVLQILQRQVSESLRCQTILEKIRRSGQEKAHASGYESYENGGDNGDEENASSTSVLYHSDTYSAFEVSLLHGSAAMVLKIAEVIRSLAIVAAKGTNFSLGASSFSSELGEQPIHPLGTISLSASFLRDHLISVSPTVRAVLYDLFRVTSVSDMCGMQNFVSFTSNQSESSSSSDNNSDTEDENEEGAKEKGAKDSVLVDSRRLTFADVRMIGIGELRRLPGLLQAHVDAIFTLQHEKSVLRKELLPTLLQSRSVSTSSLTLRIEVDEDSASDLPLYLQKHALQAVTTSAVAGRYAAIDTTDRFPFLSSIVIKFVERAEDASGLRVSEEGPSRLIDTIAFVDGAVVVGSEVEGDGIFGEWGSTKLTDLASHMSASAAIASSRLIPFASDINQIIEVTIGSHIPTLRKLIDAKCHALTEFFQTRAKTLPAWRAFTPLHALTVRVDWSGGGSGVNKFLGTFSQRSSAMKDYKALAEELEISMRLLLSDDVLGGRLDSLRFCESNSKSARAIQRSKNNTSTSILELIQSTLVASGYAQEESPQPANQGVTRSICFCFMPTINTAGNDRDAFTAGSDKPIAVGRHQGKSAFNGLPLPLRPSEVVTRHREGSELIIPFCSLGIGKPLAGGDGIASLEPILCDPLRTYFSPIIASIERAGALATAQQLKDKHFVQPLLSMLEGSKAVDGQTMSIVREFCQYVRFKLELEDDISALGSVRLSQVQTALQNFASVLGNIAVHLGEWRAGEAGVGVSSSSMMTSLDTNPHAIVPRVMARNIFSSVKAITVVFTTNPKRTGVLRRVPAGSSGATRMDSIGDGSKVVMIVTDVDGHRYCEIRDQLWHDTLRIEMARISHMMQSTVSDLKHQLSTYYPTAEFKMPISSKLVNGGFAPSSHDADAEVAAFIEEGERAVYQSELLRLTTVPTIVPSLALQPLLKGLAVGWDTALGTKLREAIRTIQVTVPSACPSPNVSSSPSVHAVSNAIQYDASTATLSYACAALFYPPPREAITVASLLLSSEAVAGQMLVSIADSIDITNAVELGRPFAPFCVPVRPLHCNAHRYLKGADDQKWDPSGSSSSLWTAYTGQRFSFAIKLRNILNQSLTDDIDRYNSQQRRASRDALMQALDDAIAAGALGHVNVSKHIRQVEAKARRTADAVTVQWPSALSVKLRITRLDGGVPTQEQTLPASDDQANRDSFTRFSAELRKSEGAIIVSVFAPTVAGTYSVSTSFMGSFIDCGSRMLLSVVPFPCVRALMARPSFPHSAHFFSGRLTQLTSSTHFSAVNAIVRGRSFLVHVGLTDANGVPFSSRGFAMFLQCLRQGAKKIALEDGVSSSSKLSLIQIDDASGDGFSAHCGADDITSHESLPTAQVSVSLQGANAGQLCIVSARFVVVRTHVVMEVELRSGKDENMKRSAPRISRRETMLNKRDAARFAKRREDCESDEEEKGEEEADFRLDDVRLVIRLTNSQGESNQSDCLIFKTLTVMSPSEWLSAEAARRGLLGDLAFMREGRRNVEQAIVNYFLRLYRAGDDKMKIKQAVKEGVHQQYDKMKKRLAERCALYFRRATRRAQLARRQTEAQSANSKGLVVPIQMLLRSLNNELLVDEELLRLKARTLFEKEDK